MARTTVKISGLKQLDSALTELSKGAARGALRRALIKAAEPMRAAAERNAPEDIGELKRSIVLTTRIDNQAGRAEYANVMKSGGSKSQAVQAMRDARRGQGVGESFAEAYMGPEKGSKRLAIKSVVQEFGSSRQSAQPYMRPAFDAEAANVINRVGDELSAEISKSVRRARARALKKSGT